MLESKEQFDWLPSIFPIVVYSGQGKWTAPVNIADLIENNELLGDFSPNFKYFKIAQNEIGVNKLLDIGNVVSTLFLGEGHHNRALLIQEFRKNKAQPRKKKSSR